MPYKDPKKRRQAEKRYRERHPERVRESHRRWMKAHPERRKEHARKWAANNKEAIRNKAYRYKYGITCADKERMYREQGGLCGACGLPLPENFHEADTDHDHITGVVRALLHHHCNVAEGIEAVHPGALEKVLEYVKYWSKLREQV